MGQPGCALDPQGAEQAPICPVRGPLSMHYMHRTSSPLICAPTPHLLHILRPMTPHPDEGYENHILGHLHHISAGFLAASS